MRRKTLIIFANALLFWLPKADKVGSPIVRTSFSLWNKSFLFLVGATLPDFESSTVVVVVDAFNQE